MFRQAQHGRGWTQEEDGILRRRFAEGAYIHQVAGELGRSQEATRTRANVLGVPVRTAPRDILKSERPSLKFG